MDPDTGEDNKPEPSMSLAASAAASVMLRTISGACHSANKRAIDWSSNGLLAYGSHGVVVVVDPISMQHLQCLDAHKATVIKICWIKDVSEKHVAGKMTLASADTAGHIFIWNVNTGEVKVKLKEGNRPVPEMAWMQDRGRAEHFLMALHLPSTVTLWDTSGPGSRVWTKTFAETHVRGFDLDPFDASRLLLSCNSYILFFNDLSMSKAPTGSGKRFCLSRPSQPLKGSPVRYADSDPCSTPTASSKLKRIMKEFVNLGDQIAQSPQESSSMVEASLSDCLQVMFHRSARNHLLLMYSSEILIIDMDIGMTVGVISSSGSHAFTQLYSSRLRDAIFVLHDNGSVSLRSRSRLYESASDSPAETYGDGGSLEICYDQRCLSEQVRLSKNAKVLGLACHPVTERGLAIFTSDGRLLLLDLSASHAVVGLMNRPTYSLDDLLPSLLGPSADPTPPLRLYTSAILSGVLANFLVIRMCPPLTMKNLPHHRPLCAVGGVNGNIQVLNMSTGNVERDFSVHTFPVRGIEWTGLQSFLSHAHQNLSGPSSSALVRNELVATDISTGKTTSLRSHRAEEPPIQMIRVSHLKQYFIISLAGAPFELWDFKNLQILRTMPKKFPPITALEWSPLHNLKSLRKRLQEEKEKQDEAEVGAVEDSSLVAKEHFVFTDPEGQLYHFSVEGNAIRDGTKVAAEASLNTITCIAWKSDHIVRGDSDGNLNVWDVRTRVSRNISTNRGLIRKIRFAPGRGNMKLFVLHSDSVAIWDVKECELINELRMNKELTYKPIDIEWAASDRPVLATADGFLRVMSLALTSSTSALMDYSRTDAALCVSLLPNQSQRNLSVLLQHQPWRQGDPFQWTLDDGFSQAELETCHLLLSALDPDLKAYLCSDKVLRFCMPNRARCLSDICSFLKQVSQARKCFLASQLSGLTWESDFWRLVVATVESDSCVQDLGWDLVCQNDLYRRNELDRLTFHRGRCSTYSQKRKVMDLMLCLGLREEAMQLLLETEPTNENYYSDHLLASLVATTADTSEANNSTVKLVATNLIAEGRLWHGVQLLCLIGKLKEACSYLQSYQAWDASLWLAKCRMRPEEAELVADKYCEHLGLQQLQKKGILIMLSMGKYVDVLDRLLAAKMFATAAQFYEVCKEARLLPDTSHVFVLNEEISLAYAKYLYYDCGNPGAANFYCDRADEKGELLQREFQMQN